MAEGQVQHSPFIQKLAKNLPLNIHPTGFDPVSAELLENIIHRIVVGAKPEKIILFGSYAYGNPTPDSDLDILVIQETDARPVERVLRISRLLRPRPFPMDILVRTPGEIAQAFSAGDPFIQEIMHQGKVLYERHP